MRMSCYRSEDLPQSSHQGTLRLIQQDLQGHMMGNDEKIERLQKQIEHLMEGMNSRNTRKQPEDEVLEVEGEDYKGNVFPGSASKGMLRDPLHATLERQIAKFKSHRLKKEAVTNEGRDTAFNEAVLGMLQQFLAHRERTSDKLQKLEGTIELARQMMQVIPSITAQRHDEGFANALDVKTSSKSGKTETKGEVPSGTIPTLKLNFPKFKVAGSFEGSQECGHRLADFGIGDMTQEWPNPAKEENVSPAWKDYIGEPIYDEEPGKGQECWPEQEFILAALNGDNLDAPNPLQTEICRRERLEEVTEFAHIQDLQQGRGNNNLHNEMPPIQLKEVSSMIPTSRDIVEAFHSKRSVKDFLRRVRDFPTAPIYYELGIRSSNLGKDNMLIFDPSGQVQDKQLKGVNHNPKDMIRSDVQLEEAVMEHSVGIKFRHWQDIDFMAIDQQLLKEPSQLQRKMSITEIEISVSWQGQGQNIEKEIDGFDKIVGEINQQFVDFMRTGRIAQPYQYQYMVLGQGKPEIYKSMDPAYHETSRKSVATYIFDPGGDSTCLHGVLLVSVGILVVNHMLPNVLNGVDGEELCTKGVGTSTMRTWLFLRREDCQDLCALV